MIEQDWERVKNYLNDAASFYGYGSFDIFINADLKDKKELAEKIFRLAEFLQDKIIAAEIAVLKHAAERIGQPIFTFRGLWRGFLYFFD